MGFIERELSLIGIELGNRDESDPTYKRLYDAQQALAWATEPDGFKSPYAAIMGIQAAPGDCSAHPRQPSS